MKQCLFLCLLTACSFGYHEGPHIQRANMLAAQVSKTYQEKNRLFQYGSGGGMSNGIERVACSFAGYRPIDVAEGRRLFVEGVESLRASFNNDRAIRPYLHNYPFEIENIDFTLSFRDPVNRVTHIPAPHISLIYCVRNIVFYEVYDRLKEKFSTYYEEPYEEALRIVQEEQKNDCTCIEE